MSISGRECVSEAYDNVPIEPHASRPGRRSFAVAVLLVVSILAAQNWTQLKMMLGLE
jgi:hypothetical protein